MEQLPEVILICGFSGAGKTATGKALAEKINYPFTDTDSVVEDTVGKPITDIFLQQGEAKFRFAESDVIRMAVKKKPQVIALGGGSIEDEGNLTFLKSAGTLVYLKVSIDTVYERIKEGPMRPMLDIIAGSSEKQEEVIKARIEKLLDRRQKYYDEADVAVDTEGKTPEAVADEIISLLNGNDA